MYAFLEMLRLQILHYLLQQACRNLPEDPSTQHLETSGSREGANRSRGHNQVLCSYC